MNILPTSPRELITKLEEIVDSLIDGERENKKPFWNGRQHTCP